MKSGQPLPEKMLTFEIVAVDKIGNESVATQSIFCGAHVFHRSNCCLQHGLLFLDASKFVDQILVNATHCYR